MTANRYAPKRGDAVWISLSPQAGHEQAGRRPALALSPLAYNAKVGLGLFCPITSKEKGYPFEVAIPDNLGVAGVVLADQIKSLDWRKRQVEFISELPSQVVEDVLDKVRALLEGSKR